MNKGLEAFNELKEGHWFDFADQYFEINPKFKMDLDTIEDALIQAQKDKKELESIKENLKYGYVFIGYDKDHKPLFQFADTKLYEEIKKNLVDNLFY